MKQSASRRPIAVLVTSALLLCATPLAAGQQTQPTDISGAWRFQSSPFEDDCTMTGAISFKPAKTAGAFTCAFVIETRCKYATDKVQEYWRVSEPCTARKTGSRVQITSRVGKVEAATWQDKPRPVEVHSHYLPDNFDVVLKANGAEMTGHVFDPVRKVPMRLWREGELVS